MTVLLCFALFLAAVFACLMLGLSLVPALLFGLVLFTSLGLMRGHSLSALASTAWAKGRTSLIVVSVFLVIGVITALWRASGTIAFFLYHGLGGISPPLFLLTAFLLSALLSFSLGSSFGVVGTCGVILITMARSGGVDPAITAGAILSGAYFGDRCSPMSSCAMLVAACTGTELYRNIREMLKTVALPTVLTTAAFAVLSVRHPISSVNAGVLSALSEQFSLHWATLLPAVIMLALCLLKVPVKWAIGASAVTAFLLAVLLQGMTPVDALRTAVFGYQPTHEALKQILSGGGLVSMLSSGLVVFLTSVYIGILEGIHALDSAHAWVERITNKLGLFPAAALLSVLLAAVFCNQSATILMGEQLLSESYRRQNASRTELAMDIANSGVVIAPLIPWNIALSVPLSMLDMGLEAWPWCVLLYLIPLCYLPTKRYFRAGQNRPVSPERT